ncbi:hypothetical protein [Candidatus Pantoea formicae]|uniref:hypothetical protein n=1 Tax=Candidatus Pantoea formicae TaxID=2608355 RepID=UPI003ED99FA7
MADYGLQLFNDNGYSVVDSNNPNFALRSSGTISSWPAKSGDISYADVDLSAFNQPLLFFRSTNSSQRISLYAPNDQAGGGAGNTIQGKRFRIYKWYNLNASGLQYYIFDRWIPPERSEYGIQMWDDSQNLSFDSGWNFLTIRNVLWLDPGYPNHSNDTGGANWTQVGSAGSGTVALSMPCPRTWKYFKDISSSPRSMLECFHLDTSNNIFTSLVPQGVYINDSPVLNGWADSITRSQVMVADVSRLPASYNPVTWNIG